jgi:hypothetical protein
MTEAQCSVIGRGCTSGAVRTSVFFSSGSTWDLCTTGRVPGSSQLCQPRVSHDAAGRAVVEKEVEESVLLGAVIPPLKANSIFAQCQARPIYKLMFSL